MNEKIEQLIKNRENFISEVVNAITSTSAQTTGPLRRIEFHNRLQHQTSCLAARYDLYGVNEYKVEDFRRERWDGYIDVVWATGFGKRGVPVAAFEIDSSLGKKSVEKLLAVDVSFRFWLYYGKKGADLLLEENDPERLITLVNVKRPEFIRS